MKNIQVGITSELETAEEKMSEIVGIVIETKKWNKEKISKHQSLWENTKRSNEVPDDLKK